MWRLVSLASLLFMLALGTPAEAKCGICVESIRAETVGSAGPYGGSTITLRLTARSQDGSALPPAATAVVMQVDGQRSKCINVSLSKIDEVGGLGAYRGTFSGYGQTAHTGRLDIGGNIHDFSVPLNGAPGTVTLVDIVAPAATIVSATAAPAAPAPQQVTQAQPAAARVDTATLDLGALAQRPLVMVGLALAAIALMVYGERRRAVGRTTV